ncbi:hypothetical protein [Burkholderia multivorans]|uniref:hypothetical protein n=1 Tax=Burkholderia multivorans TaxID=87883 RepID=UPI000D00CF88|nr:hypothetical protein [Burkholderia multivorans]PRE27517.1 hypothetical protein C6P79_14425 [Burkholderia multivorans]
MSIFAIVESGIVTNVVVWDGDESTWQPPTGATAIQMHEDDHFGIGWKYDGASFSPPESINN